MSDVSPERFEQAVSRLQDQARVALHFHPDRPVPGERSVAASLLADGIYRSQFETGISNGGLSAHLGGARHRWETQIFGEAYEKSGFTPAERPKYGALDLMLHPDGPSPRFGSCYFLLTADVSQRCTFTYLDSHEDPDEKGTYEAFDDIISTLLADAFKSDFALGEADLSPARLVDHLVTQLDQPVADRFTRPPSRNLNHYIEAQVHGEVLLGNEVEALVADPSFKGTETGRILEALCDHNDVALHWHAGFSLAPADVPSDFRGPTMPSLARRVSDDEPIDAYRIGLAATTLKADPGSFADRGTYAEVLQELKLLWHVLVRYGRPGQN